LSCLEFALALPDMESLREAPDIPTQLCPSNPDAVAFALDLIDDILAFHAEDSFFHLGGDETPYLGHCRRCAARVEKLGRIETWGRHHRLMAQHILTMGKQPMFWDDIFRGDPGSVARAGLPADTVLCCRDAVTTDYTPESMPQVDVYHQNGFATIAAPALNRGVMVPRRGHTLTNAWAWASRMYDSDMAGMLNTAPACCHVPPAATLLQIAATATLCQGDPVDDAWEDAFYQKEYGATVPRLPEAMEALGTTWDITVPELPCPVTLIAYGCQDLALHFAGGQEEQRRRGLYPLDWTEIDHPALYRKKIALLRGLHKSAELAAHAAKLADRYAAARTTFEALAAAAVRNPENAAMFALFAALKENYARAIQFHLGPPGADAASLRAALESLTPRLEQELARLCEPQSAARLLQFWHLPVLAALADPSP